MPESFTVHFLFAAYSIWFWLSAGVIFLILIAVSEIERREWGFLWLAAWVGAMMAFTDFNPVPWVQKNWPVALAIVLGYYALGPVYMFFRWVLLVRDPNEYTDRNSARHYWTPEKRAVGTLQPSWYKDRLISWSLWWLPSLTWWLTATPRRVVRAIYNACEGILSRVATSLAPKRPNPNLTGM